MKILVLHGNLIHKANWGHQLFKKEIGRQQDVIYFGKGFPNYNPNLTVPQIINKYCNGKPDVILTYCNYQTAGFGGRRDINNIIKAHIIIDYMDGRIPTTNVNLKKYNYDLIFGVTNRAANKIRKNKICKRAEWLPFSVDTNIYKKLDLPKTNDVLAVFRVRDIIYPNRGKIHDMLREMKIKIMIDRIIHKDLIEAINKSKIIITSNNKWGALSMRYTETLACGGFLLADKPGDLDKLGYVDGKHLVIYKDLNDLKDKIEYYLKPENEKEREEIAQSGMSHVRINHSCEVRVKEMIDIIEDVLNK